MQSTYSSSSLMPAGKSSIFSKPQTSYSRDEKRGAGAPASTADVFTQAICGRLEYLNANDVALLVSKAKPKFFSPGETLISEGVRSPGFFMMRGGDVEVRRGGVSLAKMKAGDVCGEMSFLEDSVASASVVASTTTTVEFLSAEDLHGIFAAFPHLASRFYRSMALTLSRRLRATSQQLCAAQAR